MVINGDYSPPWLLKDLGCHDRHDPRGNPWWLAQKNQARGVAEKAYKTLQKAAGEGAQSLQQVHLRGGRRCGRRMPVCYEKYPELGGGLKHVC